MCRKNICFFYPQQVLGMQINSDVDSTTRVTNQATILMSDEWVKQPALLHTPEDTYIKLFK